MPHGVLFIIYLILACLLKNAENWNRKDLIIIMLASILPFGKSFRLEACLRNKSNTVDHKWPIEVLLQQYQQEDATMRIYFTRSGRPKY